MSTAFNNECKTESSSSQFEPLVSLHGDCLNLLPALASESVDMVLCDLPYGTTACKWDVVIPFELLWKEYKRIIKKNRAIVLFGSEPFSSCLRLSNIEQYKYDWVWDKISKGDIMNAKNKPLKQHETISIFSEGTTANCSKRRMPYHPIGVTQNMREPNKQNRTEGAFKGIRPSHKTEYKRQGTGYPSSILRFSNANHTKGLHPTQKPVALMEYLIKTYTNENDVVLDNCMGSGTTGVACVNTKRRFIGMEKEEKYFLIASKRISDALNAVSN